MIEQVPQEYVPGWLQMVLCAVFGAGGVRMVGVWLENRRLSKAEFRDTLLGRIQSLEGQVSVQQETIASLRELIGTLSAENRLLKRAIGVSEAQSDQNES